MSSLKNEGVELRETTCPQCGKKFKTLKVKDVPNCFYCELKRYPNLDNPDYRDVAAARMASGTYTQEQNKIYWKSVCDEDPMPQFPGFTEGFDIPKKEIEIEMIPLTTLYWKGTTKELEALFLDWFRGFLSASKVVYKEKEDVIMIRVPDFVKNSDNSLLGLNLKFISQFFASIAKTLAKKFNKRVEFEIRFPKKYSQLNFTTMGY